MSAFLRCLLCNGSCVPSRSIWCRTPRLPRWAGWVRATSESRCSDWYSPGESLTLQRELQKKKKIRKQVRWLHSYISVWVTSGHVLLRGSNCVALKWISSLPTTSVSQTVLSITSWSDHSSLWFEFGHIKKRETNFCTQRRSWHINGIEAVVKPRLFCFYLVRLKS